MFVSQLFAHLHSFYKHLLGHRVLKGRVRLALQGELLLLGINWELKKCSASVSVVFGGFLTV